jgi:hypothetical protein
VLLQAQTVEPKRCLLMKNNLVNGVAREEYLVQIDGITASEHLGFIEALKMGLKLRQQHPHSDVKVREAEASPQATDVRH